MIGDLPLLRTVGGWMAAAGGALMLVNAARAAYDPAGFAGYLGLPLADSADAALVHVYALRALFIGLLVAALIVAGQRAALAILALAAVVMPAGDALLSYSAGADMATVARHVAIALSLLVSAALLARQKKRPA